MHGTPFEETIESCTDITKFLTLRNVNGGAEFKGEKLGKAIRWYYVKGSKDTINYCTNGNLVPRSYGSKPLMNLPEEFPKDIDYEWYINEWVHLVVINPNDKLLYHFANGIFTQYDPLHGEAEKMHHPHQVIANGIEMSSFEIEDATRENLPIFSINKKS